ncbi:MAG: hypothetical protein FWJ70_03180 [Micromonosporaceae bacterium]
MDIAELRGFSRRLMRLATEAGSVADALAGVTADTGRADSDEMGRLAGLDAHDLLRQLSSRLVDDGKLIAVNAARYEAADAESSTMLGGEEHA